MWIGVLPAVTANFKENASLDSKELERCFVFQLEAGVDGLIVNGSLGEGPMLSHDERLEVLRIARGVAGRKPVLMTIADAATRECAELARRAAKAGADGLMVVPSLVHHTNPKETVATLRAVAEAADDRARSLPLRARFVREGNAAGRRDRTRRRSGGSPR